MVAQLVILRFGVEVVVERFERSKRLGTCLDLSLEEMDFEE